MKYPAIHAFLSYIRRYRRAFIGVALVFAVADVIISMIPWLIGQLANALTENKDGIVLWTALLILASVGHDFLWRVGELLHRKFITRRGHEFDNVVFDAVLRQPYGFFVDKFTGKISSYAKTLGQEFRELQNEFLFSYVNLFVALPVIAITMFTVNLYTGMIFVVSLSLMYFVGRKFAKAAANAERIQADEKSTVDGYTVDAVSNFVSVKAFGNERRELKEMRQRRQRVIRAALESDIRNIYFWASMSIFIRWIIWSSTFILNVYLYTQGELSLAQITTFLTAIVLFSSFIWEVVWNISQVNIKLANTNEAYIYLFGQHNIFKEPLPELPKPLPADALKHTLELRSVSFAYPDKPGVDVLKDINLRVRQGEKIGIVGHSGGGKSTLLKLLLGYYPIQKGELLIDDAPVSNEQLTNLTAYVPQDTAVFHRSIRDNIAYGRSDATEEEIVAASKHALAHEFVTSMDTGYDTLVGERGVKLSGGQRQRIAIARAILKDAPVLLLDEATSALDSESERLIQVALWELMKGRTAIVIAHRLSTIQKMDRILVVDDGQVVEEGTHAQLVEQGGIYAQLWAHQSGGFIEE
jgi:ATP-binding cassette, subfamily B, bacterial